MPEAKYVVMKWKDGWQEVVAVEPDAVGFRKYYVIERIEHFGRLVLDRPQGEYPGMVVIDRDPLEIEKIALLGTGDQRVLASTDTYREGTRLEYNYDLQQDGNLLAELKEGLRRVLAEKGMSPADVVRKDDADILQVAKEAKIVGGKSQEDLANFVKTLLAEQPDIGAQA